jgi:hypothetical protein
MVDTRTSEKCYLHLSSELRFIDRRRKNKQILDVIQMCKYRSWKLCVARLLHTCHNHNHHNHYHVHEGLGVFPVP